MEVLNNFQTFVFSILLSIDSIVVASKVVKWQSLFGLAGHICNFTNDLFFSLKKRGKLVLPLGLLGNNDFPDNQKLLFYYERIGTSKLLMPQGK
jgi:hypothetical protein